MADQESKRPARKRKSTVRYATDASDQIDLSDESDVQVTRQSKSNNARNKHDYIDVDQDEEDEDYESLEPRVGEADNDDDNEYNDEMNVDDEHDDDHNNNDNDDDEEEQLDAVVKHQRNKSRDKHNGSKDSTASTNARRERTNHSNFTANSRGLVDPKSSLGKDSLRYYIFGPTDEDQNAALQGMYRWKNQPVLPSRKADGSGFGGYHRSYFVKDGDRKKEMEMEWKWYDEYGGDAFRKGQLLESIDGEKATEYFGEKTGVCEVVMGPDGKQEKYSLPIGEAVHLNSAFEEGKSNRNGWLFNLGDRVSDLCWLSNQSGRSQYVAVTSSPLQKSSVDSSTNPAFQPQVGVKSCIRIYEVIVGEDSRIDDDEPPSLFLTLCFDWGHVKSLKWCPFPRICARTGQKTALLGLVTTDGCLRVLDISFDDTKSQYLSCNKAAFTAKPSLSVYSCFTWLSSHGLAAGTASGHVAVYNLSSHLSSPILTDAVQTTFAQVQTTFITNITSCAPSRPHILCTSSMSGTVSITDLTRMSVSTAFNCLNTVYSARARMGKTVMTWHDASQSILTIDDNNLLQAMPLRRLFSSKGLTRYNAGVASLGVSEVHPFVMAGTWNGDVVSTNPMRRMTQQKGDIWNLKWFNHTWRRSHIPKIEIPGPADVEAANEGGDREMVDVDAGQEGEKDGLVRIVEGFKAENVISLANPKALKSDENPHGVSYVTIYEPQTAITTIAWNPNIHVGGWIAVGTGSGLWRIEDVGVNI